MAVPALSSVPRSVCRQQRWHCGREECAGTCVATGDPHYVTFDGRAFSFPGDCEYLLARETTGLFTVTAENVPCGTSGVTCTKSVVVVMGNTVVHMLRGEGDSLSLSIAAASILAKVTRDRAMTRLDSRWPGYGFARHAGYPTALHRAALERLGPCPHHRRGFAPVDQLCLL